MIAVAGIGILGGVGLDARDAGVEHPGRRLRARAEAAQVPGEQQGLSRFVAEIGGRAVEGAARGVGIASKIAGLSQFKADDIGRAEIQGARYRLARSGIIAKHETEFTAAEMPQMMPWIQRQRPLQDGAAPVVLRQVAAGVAQQYQRIDRFARGRRRRFENRLGPPGSRRR